MPNVIPIYTRVAQTKGYHKLDAALLSVKEVGGVAITSSYDDFPTTYGRKAGFADLGGFTVTCILLAEHFDIGTICDGNILDMVYLSGMGVHGSRFKASNYSKIKNEFEKANLFYSMPCSGLTEVSTTNIAKGYKYSMGCMRGLGGEPCLNCMKCFRKEALKCNLIPTNAEVDKKLSGNLLPILGTLLWAREHCGLSHPKIDNVKRDISWVDKWYPPSIEHIPEQYHAYFKQRLDKFGIQKLTDTDALEKWSSSLKTTFVLQ